jgi:hypothetical protein
MTAGSADTAAAVVLAAAATAFAADSRRVTATAAHASGDASGTPGLPPPLNNDSSTLPGADSDPRGDAAVSDGAVAAAGAASVISTAAAAKSAAGLSETASSPSETDARLSPVVTAGFEAESTRVRRAGAAEDLDVELRCAGASGVACEPARALPRASRAAEGCEDVSEAPAEPEVSAPAIGIEASAEPTPSATDRVLIRPTARNGRLLRSGADDPSPDDI